MKQIKGIILLVALSISNSELANEEQEYQECLKTVYTSIENMYKRRNEERVFGEYMHPWNGDGHFLGVDELGKSTAYTRLYLGYHMCITMARKNKELNEYINDTKTVAHKEIDDRKKENSIYAWWYNTVNRAQKISDELDYYTKQNSFKEEWNYKEQLSKKKNVNLDKLAHRYFDKNNTSAK